MDKQKKAPLSGAVVCFLVQGAMGQVQTFVNDFDRWAVATGPFSTIDFETLPDGSPSVSSTEINALLNYTNQGATFSSPLDDLIIAGNITTGFNLRSDGGTFANPTEILGELVIPAFSTGFFFPGNATFKAFDERGGLLASEFFGSSGSGFFLGIVSDVPISFVIMDEGTSTSIHSFHFAPVPEPVTATLVALGVLSQVSLRRRTRKPSPAPVPC